MINFRKIKPIIKKEFRQISRDRNTLGMLLFIPALMIVVFGYALNFDIKHVPVAILDYDKSADSRRLIERFAHNEYFDIKYRLDSEKEIDLLMMREKVRAVIVIPPGFAKKLLMRQNVSVQVIIDGANANAANTSAGYISAVIQEFSLNVLAETMLRWGKGVITMPVDYRPRIWYNPELVSAKFLIPGLIAFIMMVTAVISTSLSIVREKERGTMEQIAVSPLKSSELIIGKTIPYVIISLFSSLMILLAGWILFGVAVKGSILLLFAVILIFLISCLAVGLLISSLVESQQLAFMLSVILTILPTFILSGFVFPIRNMPFVIQAISYIVPARYFLVALRAIIIKGVGIAGFWEQLLALVVITTIAMGAASARLRKKRL